MFDCSLIAYCFLAYMHVHIYNVTFKKQWRYHGYPFGIALISSDHRETITYCFVLSFTMKSAQVSPPPSFSPKEYFYSYVQIQMSEDIWLSSM